jgi:hypothetical protein
MVRCRMRAHRQGRSRGGEHKLVFDDKLEPNFASYVAGKLSDLHADFKGSQEENRLIHIVGRAKSNPGFSSTANTIFPAVLSISCDFPAHPLRRYIVQIVSL